MSLPLTVERLHFDQNLSSNMMPLDEPFTPTFELHIHNPLPLVLSDVLYRVGRFFWIGFVLLRRGLRIFIWIWWILLSWFRRFRFIRSILSSSLPGCFWLVRIFLRIGIILPFWALLHYLWLLLRSVLLLLLLYFWFLLFFCLILLFLLSRRFRLRSFFLIRFWHRLIWLLLRFFTWSFFGFLLTFVFFLHLLQTLLILLLLLLLLVFPLLLPLSFLLFFALTPLFFFNRVNLFDDLSVFSRAVPKIGKDELYEMTTRCLPFSNASIFSL